MTADELDAQRYRLIKRDKELRDRQDALRKQIKSIATAMKYYITSIESSGYELPTGPQRPDFSLLTSLLDEAKANSMEIGENTIKMQAIGASLKAAKVGPGCRSPTFQHVLLRYFIL